MENWSRFFILEHQSCFNAAFCSDMENPLKSAVCWDMGFNAAFCSDMENNRKINPFYEETVSMPRFAATWKIITQSTSPLYNKFQCRVLQRHGKFLGEGQVSTMLPLVSMPRFAATWKINGIRVSRMLTECFNAAFCSDMENNVLVTPAKWHSGFNAAFCSDMENPLIIRYF